MRIRKPSPAMVVAIIALVMASTGSAVAAVSFARNAGAVDRLSAVDAGTSTKKARGRLVATGRAGENSGRIPSKFLAGIVYGDSFGTAAPVADNSSGAPVEVAATALGTMTAACNDQTDSQIGTEDPTTTITFSNTSGRDISFFRRVGVGDQVITTLAPGTAESFTINNQNNFRIHAESLLTNVVLDGVVRQLNPRTGDAACLVFGVEQLAK